MTTNEQSSDESSQGQYVDPNNYLWQLERKHVDIVLHYTHWIPVGRGFTEQLLAKDYPGWTLGQLVELFDRAGIRILPEDNDDAAGAPHGGRCHWQVAAFYFSDPENFHVVWDCNLPYDADFKGMSIAEENGTPKGAGPSKGKHIEAVARRRPVDLSGKIFFD